MNIKDLKLELRSQKKALDRFIQYLYDCEKSAIYEKDKKKISAITGNAFSTIYSIDGLMTRLQGFKDKKLFK